MYISGVDKKINIWLLVLFLCLFEDVFLENPYREVRADYPKGCAYLRCKRGDQCVNRKFWCKNSPCPSMLYCSKSRKESLKGPESCEAVRCSKGFVCLVRARYCRWDEACDQQIARCISERDYYEGPASCVDFRCPSGHRCILRESLCARPPCKLLRSCANIKDVKIWLEECRNLGCLSEHECFLRRPDQNCPSSPCKHTPDCSAKSEEDLENREQCRGWVCPKGQECSSHTKGPCKRESCRISRSCHKPLMVPVNTTPSPQHSWRDDIKLSFYSKQEKNSSAAGKNRFSSGPLTDKISRSNTPIVDKKNLINSKDRNIDSINKAQIYKLPNSRSSLSRPDIASGRVVKPTVTSLTTWLNHLKLVTGIDAVEVWIKRADRQENHEEFLEWLESVKDMLGSAAYDLWLQEVRAMTVTHTAFQKWLPPSPTNRSTDSHHLVETYGNLAGTSHEGPEISPGSRNFVKYSNNQEGDDFQPEGIRETAGLRADDFKESKFVFPVQNETPIKESVFTLDNSIPNLPMLPPTQPTIGINEWSQLYSPNPRRYQQAYPIQQNFVNPAGPWNNQAVPYRGFDNVPLSNPPYPQFPANWSFPEPPDGNPELFTAKPWQNQFLPPVYPQWQPDRDPRDEISPDPRLFLEPPSPPEPIFPSLPEDPAIKFYPRNFTNEDTPWIKYFADPYEKSKFVTPENFGSHPIADRNFGYLSSWPGSSYQGQSLSNVPHRRSKHEGIEAGNSRYVDRSAGESGEKLRDPSEDPSPYYSGFPWEFMEPRLRDNYLHLLNYNRRSFYDKKNKDGSAILPSLSRTHRVDDVDPRLSLPNRYLDDNGLRVPQPEHHWTSFYPHPRIYGVPGGTRSPSLANPFVGAREDEHRIDPFLRFNPFDVDDDGVRGLFVGNRINRVSGQAMEFPNLWNSRYRNPSSSFLRKIAGEQFFNRDTVTRNRPTSTILPPVVPTKIVTARIFPVPSEVLPHAKNNDDPKKIEKYFLEDDDGIFPLLLSLQGYIESPSRQVFQDSSKPPKNSTILPVYTIDSDAADNDYDGDYEAWGEDEAIHLFRNEKYGGRPDFPNNLKDIFELEAALIGQNQTGQSDIGIKNIKWEYEDSEDPNNDDISSFRDQTQPSVPSTDVSSNDDPSRGWVVNKSGAWNDERTETDYYGGTVDYGDETVPGDKNYFDPEEINIDGLLNPDDMPDDLNDHFYDDTDHKRFKKNRPL